MASAWVVIVLAELIVIAFLARLLPRLWSYLVLGQVGYWMVSYVGRPAVLLWVKPIPRRGDSLADPRLAADGYGDSLAGSMQLVAGGLAIYLVLLALVALWVRRRGMQGDRYSLKLGDPSMTAVFVPLWILGWGSRVLAPSAAPTSAVVALAHALCAVSAVSIVLLIRFERAYQLVFALSFVIGGELWWSVSIASKTPILAVLLALVLRVGSQARPRQLAIAAVVASIAAYGAFASVQGLKESSRSQEDQATVESAYPAAVTPLLDVVERFDLVSAATDARLAGPGSWMSPAEYWSGAVTTLLPEQLHVSDKKQIGKRWAEEVRTGSIADANTDVYLATGFIAPGWAVDGWRGVVAEAIGAVLALVVVARLLSSRTSFLFALGASLIAQPAIFERSFVGVAEIVSRGLQVGVVTFLCALLMRALSSSVRGRAGGSSWRRLGAVSSEATPPEGLGHDSSFVRPRRTQRSAARLRDVGAPGAGSELA